MGLKKQRKNQDFVNRRLNEAILGEIIAKILGILYQM
jgi:hypothetical protein